MRKTAIVQSLTSAGIPKSAFNLETIKRGRKYRLTIYVRRYAHDVLPYTVYARYATWEEKPLTQPSTYIIER